LIVCGHTKRKTDGALSLGGWLGQLGAVVALDTATIPESLDVPIEIDLPQIGCRIAPFIEILNSKFKIPTSTDQAPSSNLKSLVAPLIAPVNETADDKTREREADPPSRVWRVVPVAQRPRGPAWVVGKLTHEAIRRWRFPERGDFEVFLHPHALALGLTDPREIGATISEVRRLLERFQAHELYAEMNTAQRLHELPYTHQGDTGIIDVLYRVGETWRVVDFKTDDIRDEEKLREKIQEYREQMARYAAAVVAFIGTTPETQLCFLDVRGQVHVLRGD
jgi:ATP-dependent exoDNAse (exonuclease V) beta subunit